MIVQDKNVIREITPLSEKDCFYIADRRKSEFTYPMHCHKEFELNFVINAPGVQRIVGDSAEIIGEYDLVLRRLCRNHRRIRPGTHHQSRFGACMGTT